jgi:cytochrome c556
MHRLLTVFLFGTALLASLGMTFANPTRAYAESIKPLMREMKATTREAAALTRGSFDSAAARHILDAYITQSERALAISNPANRTRFQTFIADARAAAATISTSDQFTKSLTKLTGQCRSCHDAN